MTEVRRNEDDGRYEILVDGEVAGFTQFRPRADGVVVLPHTEVDAAYRGQGLSGKLISGALDDIRDRGEQIVAQCPAVARFVGDHAEYADLLAAA